MSDGYPVVAVAALAGLGLNFLTHLLTAVLTAGRRVGLSVLTGVCAGLVGTAVLTTVGLSALKPELVDAVAFATLNLAIYLALAFGYFNFVNLNMTSLRIRVLLELLEAREGLSREDVLQLYNAEELLERRLARLKRQGYLVEQQGRFCRRGSSLLLLARGMTMLKWVVLGHGNRTLQAALLRERTEPNDPTAEFAEPRPVR